MDSTTAASARKTGAPPTYLSRDSSQGSWDISRGTFRYNESSLRLLAWDQAQSPLPFSGSDMPTRSATELESLLDQLEKQEPPIDGEILAAVSGEIAKRLGVQFDEVAILELQPTRNVLKFVLPVKLRTIGSIPLKSAAALAARTARERRSDIINNFAESRHASVFEGVPLGRGEGVHIQKLMSAPIVRSGTVVGVVQISRKGESLSDCGADFKPSDLKLLQGLNDVIARFLIAVRQA